MKNLAQIFFICCTTLLVLICLKLNRLHEDSLRQHNDSVRLQQQVACADHTVYKCSQDVYTDLDKERH